MSTTILRRLRLERGLTLRETADLVGTSHVTIYNLERGESNGRPRTRAALARAFDIPADVLLMVDTTTKNGAEPKPDAAGVTPTTSGKS
jgi:transcriptional regulator with XRE-family HTH domain